MDPQTARSRLEEMLADLDRSSATLTAENAGESSELSSLDQHPADNATQLSDQDREQAVLEAVDVEREQVRAALARIEDGSYGRCVDCGEQIAEERLEARPEAARCLPCQAKLESVR